MKRPPVSYNNHQPKKSPSTAVGAREIDVGLGGLLKSSAVGYLKCWPNNARATIKAHRPAHQPPSPLRNPRLVLRLMPIEATIDVIPISGERSHTAGNEILRFAQNDKGRST
jgi:hypothetical protein